MPFFTTLRSRASKSTLFIALVFAHSIDAQTLDLSQSLKLSGEYAMALDESASYWLSVGENSGIQVNDAAGKTLSRWPLNAEYLDSRIATSSAGERRVFASVDKARNQFLLYSLNGEYEIQQEFISSTLDFPLEGLCLHRDYAKRLHVFLLSELFEARQYLLSEDHGNWQMMPLRSLPTGPSSEFCTADDFSATVFVSESEQALWAYPTNPEAEVSRILIDVAAPFGNLGDGPLGLAASQGRLHVVSGDGPTVHEYLLQDGEFHYAPEGRFELASSATVGAQSMNLSDFGESQLLTLFDEERSRFTRIDLAATTSRISESVLPEVMATVETTPMPQRGDAADDPAFWVHPSMPNKSVILGTNKRQGLFVYDLDGAELQRLDVGRLNNVDIRYGVSWQGKEVDIAVATNRDLNTLAFFAIDRDTRLLTFVANIPTPLQNIYGMCLFQDAANQIYAFANDEDGTYLQFALDTSNSVWTGRLVRSFSVATQPEGCVANDKTGQLFIGEEDVGIWTLDAAPSASTTLQVVAKIGDTLHDDVEGLALYQGEEDTFLVASSQGNDSYVVMESMPPYRILGAFRIGMNLSVEKMIDGASETDGLEISSANLGGIYSAGLLIVQDGRNVLPEQAQNFKVVPWSEIQALFSSLQP